MRVICGKIPGTFVTLLTAIRNEEVKIFYNPSWEVLRGSKKSEFAIYWDIHQEFAYQLVNMGLIGYETKDNARYITDKHISDFQSEYAISTHIFRKIGNRAKGFLTFLDKKQIISIDSGWDKKLR